MLHLATKLNENSTSSFTDLYKIMQIQYKCKTNKVDNEQISVKISFYHRVRKQFIVLIIKEQQFT